MCAREAGVTGDEGCIQSFRQCDIHRIVGSDGLPQLPGAPQQVGVPVSFDQDGAEIFECLSGSMWCDVASQLESAQGLRDLYIEKMGCVKTLLACQQERVESSSLCGAQQ